MQLEVVDGLGGDEHAVGLRGQRAHELARAAAREPAVLELAGGADRLRAHAVEVLQVGADVGEAVLQRLDAAYARAPARARAAPVRARRARPGDSVTVTSAPLVSRASASACCW